MRELQPVRGLDQPEFAALRFHRRGAAGLNRAKCWRLTMKRAPFLTVVLSSSLVLLGLAYPTKPAVSDGASVSAGGVSVSAGGGVSVSAGNASVGAGPGGASVSTGNTSVSA